MYLDSSEVKVELVMTRVRRRWSSTTCPPNTIIYAKDGHILIGHPNSDDMVVVALACEWYPF